MDIAVIGGGVIGMSCALHLARYGKKVALLTETRLCSGASGRSLSWLNASGPWPEDYYRLRMAGIDRYRTLLRNNPAIEWLKFDGGLNWSDNEDLLDWHDIEQARGYDSVLFSGGSVKNIDSHINSDALPANAIYHAGEGWVSLPHLIKSMAAEFLTLGGSIIEDAGKTLPRIDAGGAVHGVISTYRGEFDCEKVLLACGPASVKSLNDIGVNLPDGSILSLLATSKPLTRRPAVVLNTPRVAMRPNPGGTLALEHSWYTADIHEDANGVCTAPQAVLDTLFVEGDRLLDIDTPLALADYKAGWKPVPADGYPVLGAINERPGCYIAFTHSGATLALIIGELLSGEIITGKLHPMLALYRPERFNATES